MDQSILLMVLLMGIIAFLYASVGHGGASGYLALMALWALPEDRIRTTALILNIAVSLIAFSQYYKQRYFNFKLFYPFAIASIPAAYFGAGLHIEPYLYKKILGFILLIPVIRLSGIKVPLNFPNPRLNIYLALFIGATIGFLSGLLGIGGGILLSPLILLFGWASIKETAAVSALFILVNSLAGLANVDEFMSNTDLFSGETTLMLVLVLTGGLAGSRWGGRLCTGEVDQRDTGFGSGDCSNKTYFCMMHIKLFGVLQEQMSKEIEFPAGVSNVTELRKVLEKKYIPLTKVNYMVAINKFIANESDIINVGDELALLPPFSGG